MFEKQMIKEIVYAKVEFVSTKANGDVNLILNLKRLNEFVKFEHFKMDGNKTTLNMIIKKCYMVKIDLDPYCSVRISKYFRLIRTS